MDKSQHLCPVFFREYGQNNDNDKFHKFISFFGNPLIDMHYPWNEVRKIVVSYNRYTPHDSTTAMAKLVLLRWPS